MNRPPRAGLAAAVVLAAALAPAPRADEAGRRLLDRYAPAVVGVDALVRAEMRMGGESEEQEGKIELVGAVVDPSGLVMVWNSSISATRFQEMLETAGPGGEDFGIRMEPVSFHVVRPGSDERLSAFLAASDSQLDVAFLQLEPPPAEPLPAISFAEVGEVAVGQRLYAVTRLGATFDRAAHYAPLEVIGTLSKPRRGWILQGDTSALGHPVFDEAGHPVGVLATVISTIPQDAGAFPWGGGSFGEMGSNTGPIGVFLLPGGPVARAIELSKERARELLEERAEAAGVEGAAGEGVEEVEEEAGAEAEEDGAGGSGG